MSKTIRKTGILILVFVAAVVVYFFWPLRQTKEEDLTYVAVQDASLPVVYPQMWGKEMAPLFGHREELAATADRDSLLVLPEDRRLPVRIAFGDEITALRYEIRSMDGENLIERTELSGWELRDGMIETALPIQNLLKKDTEYQLGICAELSDGSAAWYYSRILETDGTHAGEMLELACSFSEKTLNYEEAQALTMYMETTGGADNSTFGTVTLKNSFSQLTWGDLHVERVGEPAVTLKEYYGNMANVQVDSYVKRQTEDGEELYAVSENFTMKWSSQRIYMMDYQRKTDEMFSGDEDLYSGNRIQLGISSGEGLSAETSSGKRYTAYVVNRELWCYDSQDNTSARVFAFGGADSDDPRDNCANHDIRILSVQDDGIVEFLVYGYMNRGAHEGYTGISLYQYSSEENTIVEELFIPSSEGYEELKEDLSRLAHKGNNGMLYLYLDGNIYGVDLTSREYMAVVSGLTEDTFAVSSDRSRLAWQEGSGAYDARTLYVMDLDTGETAQIGDGSSRVYRILGFVGNDCVYGSADPENYILSNGRIQGIFMDSLDILDREMENAMHYEKEGAYIRSARVDESRIHIQLTRNLEDGFYGAAEEDTLVCNTEAPDGGQEMIGWSSSGEKGRVYFVQLSSGIPAGKKVSGVTPKKMVSGDAAVINLRQPQERSESVEFCAYGRGRFAGSYQSFSAAVNAVYDSMGFVIDGKGRMVWIRGDRSSAHTVRNAETASERLESRVAGGAGSRYLEDGALLLDAAGCTLDQVLYFVDMDVPVLAYTGENQWVILTAYDQGHVTVYNPASGTSDRMDTAQAESWFAGLGNDYVCCLPAD